MSDIKLLFRKLLEVLWLRPEKALFYAHELSAVKELIGDLSSGPSMEYGCLDGVNTFLMMGGSLQFDHDEYEDIIFDAKLLDSNLNIYSQPKYINRNIIANNASCKFDLGLSFDNTHLIRANKLNFYNELALMQLNQPLNNIEMEFNTIWAPMIFWSKPDLLIKVLKNLSKYLSKEGRLITIVPDVKQKENEIWANLPELKDEIFNILDKGISHNLTLNANSHEDWSQIFKNSGFQILSHKRFLPTIVGSVYQIGLRPMFPVLIEMYEIIRKSDRDNFLQFKAQWIDNLYHFMSPLCDKAVINAPGSELLWHAYELKRGQ